MQARAADAARANVEAHYNHILTSYQTFLDKWVLLVVTGAHAVLCGTAAIPWLGDLGDQGARPARSVRRAAVGDMLGPKVRKR